MKRRTFLGSMLALAMAAFGYKAKPAFSAGRYLDCILRDIWLDHPVRNFTFWDEDYGPPPAPGTVQVILDRDEPDGCSDGRYLCGVLNFRESDLAELSTHPIEWQRTTIRQAIAKMVTEEVGLYESRIPQPTDITLEF